MAMKLSIKKNWSSRSYHSNNIEEMKFYNFIRQRLDDYKFFKTKKILDKLKLKISFSSSTTSRIILIIKKVLFQPAFTLRYMAFRIFGSKLPIRFAKEWMNLKLRIK